MHRLVLAALLLAAIACGDHGPPVYSDPSQPIEVRAGSEFVLALKSNQSTGYRWVVADYDALAPLQLISTDYTVPRENRDRNGAGGTERWTFRAPSPGNSTISLAYRRLLKSQPPADSMRFRVTVR